MRDTEEVQLNERRFVLSHDLAAALVAAKVVDECRACDPGGLVYHLDPDHTVDELLRAGAREAGPMARPDKTGRARLPVLVEHHAGGGT